MKNRIESQVSQRGRLLGLFIIGSSEAVWSICRNTLCSAFTAFQFCSLVCSSSHTVPDVIRSKCIGWNGLITLHNTNLWIILDYCSGIIERVLDSMWIELADGAANNRGKLDPVPRSLLCISMNTCTHTCTHRLIHDKKNDVKMNGQLWLSFIL